jgi:ribosomal RNA-processing protein 8
VSTGKVVLSYDLVSDQSVDDGAAIGGGWVVQADFLSHVPLPGRPGGEAEGTKKSKAESTGSEIVNVVVCCLSLMGTNWVGGIYEACRILKQG